MLEDKDISNNGFQKVWRKAKDSKYLQKGLAIGFIIGLGIGIWLGLSIGGVI